MRILHITDTMDCATGVRRYIREVTTLFRARGHTVDVWSPPGIGDDLSSLYTRWFGLRYAREVAEKLRKGCYDILHAHNIFLRLSPRPLQVAHRMGVPIVMTVHDFNLICPRKWMIRNRNLVCGDGFGGYCLVRNCWSGRRGRWWMAYHSFRWIKTALHRAMLRSSVDLFVAPSAVLCDWLVRSLGAVNAVYIPNFVVLTEMPAYHIPGCKLVYLGRLSREKGVDVLMRAMALIVDKLPNVSLKIVGDGPERKNLESLVEMLHIGNWVAFAGEMDMVASSRALSEADLAILPSIWAENCPMVILEALGAGTPVIGSNIGGVPELVRDGENGYLFERGDAADLANKIMLAMCDRNWLDEARSSARKCIDRAFSSDKHYQMLLAGYNSLSSKH